MQLVLARTLNKRLIELHAGTRGETIGVLRRDGSYAYVPWLGFVDRAAAAELGRPVKLKVLRVGRYSQARIEWRDVPLGRHVQGCATGDGAYAVADWSVRLI